MVREDAQLSEREELLMTYRLIVTGSRNWRDADRIYGLLDQAHVWCRASAMALVVAHGNQQSHDRALCESYGADWYTHLWCKANLVEEEKFPADWSLGKKAGPLRNQQMVDKGADLCMAFWDGESRGTLDCLSRAVRAGIPVRIFPMVTRG